MPIQVVDMTTLLNISGISSGSEVNVTTENFDMYEYHTMKPMFEGKVERGTFAYLHTEERESKSLSKRKTVRELNIFTHHCLAFVNSRL